MLAEYLETFKRDYENASKVFRSACDDYGHARACMKYANYRYVGRGQAGTVASPSEALTYFEKGCKLNNSDSCMYGGQLLVTGEVKQNNADQDIRKVNTRWFEWFGVVDERGYRMFQQPRLFSLQGVDLLKRGCELNNGAACSDLFDVYITGIKRPEVKTEIALPKEATVPKPSTALRSEGEYIVPKDLKQAFGFAYKACELKNWMGCFNLSQMYARGDGTAKDPANAEKFKRIALELRGDII